MDSLGPTDPTPASMDPIGAVVEQTTHAAASPWPWWAPWILWVVVIAALVVAMAEPIKRRWIQPSKAWQKARGKRAKVQIMLPILALLGAVNGAPILYVAGLVQAWPLALALGAAIGAVSWAIYDVLIACIELIPRILKKKAGIEDTTDTADAIPPVSPEDLPR